MFFGGRIIAVACSARIKQHAKLKYLTEILTFLDLL